MRVKRGKDRSIPMYSILSKDYLCSIIEQTDHIPMNDDNAKVAFYCVNSWMFIVQQKAPNMLSIFDHDFRSIGVLGTINKCQEASDDLLHNLSKFDNGGMVDANFGVYCNPTHPYITSMMFEGVSIQDMLLVLRYPKRLSLRDVPALYDAGLKKFEDILTIKRGNWDAENTSYIDERLKEIYSVLLPKPSFKDEDGVYHHSSLPGSWVKSVLNQFKISPGSTDDAGRNKWLKYTILSAYDSAATGFIPFEPTAAESQDEYHNLDGTYQPCKHIEVRAVPKSYKTPRLIGVRRVVDQAKCYQIDAILTLAAKCAKIHQVPVNHMAQDRDFADDPQKEIRQRLASASQLLEGPMTICTTDLSSASDSISWIYLSKLYPEWYVRLVEEIRPQNVILNYSDSPKSVRNTITMLSGDACCFGNEEFVFLGPVILACELYVTWNNKTFEELRQLLEAVRTFGDDLSYPECIHEIVCQLLEYMGFTVNYQKTFSGELPYREACGAEYCNGHKIHSVYFPRKALESDSRANEFISTLVKLQHKLVANGLSSAADFVSEHVVKLAPNMTFSAVDFATLRDIKEDLDVVTDLIGTSEQVRRVCCKQVKRPTSDEQRLIDSGNLSQGEIQSFDPFANVVDGPFDYDVHVSLRKRCTTDLKPKAALKADLVAYLEFLKYGPLVSEEPRPGICPVAITRSRVESARDSLYGTLLWD